MSNTANNHTFVVSGTVANVLPVQTGTSTRGNAWKKQDFILTDEENGFVHKYCFTLFNGKVDDYAPLLTPNNTVNVIFGINTNTYNERNYTQLMVAEVKQLQ